MKRKLLLLFFMTLTVMNVGAQTTYNSAYDLNKDGQVSISDVNFLVNYLLNGASSPASTTDPTVVSKLAGGTGTQKKWYWNEDGYGFWGNTGNTGNGSGYTASTVDGKWWGVCYVSDLSGQLQHASGDETNATLYAKPNSYMVFGEDGTIATYTADGTMISSSSYNVSDYDAKRASGWSIGTLNTAQPSILWPYYINGNGKKVKEFDLMYLDDDHMTLVYTNGTSAGSWSEITYWRFCTTKPHMDAGDAISGTRTVDGETVTTTVGGTVSDYVDLGIVVNKKKIKWATHNIGATKPEECGSAIEWAELGTSEEGYVDGVKTNAANWNYLKYYDNIAAGFTKYVTSASNGTVDDLTTLESCDDAATVNWGNDWRIATKKEWQALVDNCTWTWTQQDGKDGYLVTSKINGNSIFIVHGNVSYGTSTLSATNDICSESVVIDQSSVQFYGGEGRCNPHYIRPVYEENLPSIRLNNSYLSMTVGAQDTLTASISSGLESEEGATWSSSDETVATVDANGVVTAISAGSAEITATSTVYEDVTSTCSITVRERISGDTVEGIRTVNGTTVHTAVGGTIADYVDLGMKDANGKAILWATHNLGATDITDYGAYIAWGDVGSKEEGYVNGTKATTTGYKTSSDFTGSVLDADHDAATVMWGSSWRTPTAEEWAALGNTDNFTWTWTGEGYNVKSKISGYEGRYIYLPAAGYAYTNEFTNLSEEGDYYSASFDGSKAKRLNFSSSAFNPESVDYNYYGLSIRPVRTEE